MINTDYINNLLSISENHLKESYEFTKIQFDNFELINSFLINKTLNQNKYNLFIQIPQKESKRDFYIPLIFSVAATLFLQNYVDDKTRYSIGDILQKDGHRYEICDYGNVEKFKLKYHANGHYYKLKREDNKSTVYTSSNEIKKYIVTTANLSNRKVKAKFDHYKKLFQLLFGVDYFPSKFSYKTAIINEKKDFLETIKNKHIENIELKKALPIKWITKKGFRDNKSDFIPIEPMIYLVPDYETFKEHLIDNIENLDSVIFVGRTKYEPYLRKIKKDSRRNIIPKAIFIGSEKIENFEGLKSWNWTIPEINFFNNVKPGEFNIIEIEPDEFLKNISNLGNEINKIDVEYNFDLKKLLRLKKYLYSLILLKDKSRLNTQIVYVKYLLKNEFVTSIRDSFYNINEQPEEFIESIKSMIDDIFQNLSYDKFETLLNQINVDVLIVQDRFKEIYEEEKKQFTNLNDLKIFTINEFQKKEKEYRTRKNIFLLTIFGHKMFPYELIKMLLNTSHHINLILYPEEKDFVDKIKIRYKNELIKEYISPDRLFLSGVKYPVEPKEEDISEIINKFYSKENLENKRCDYETTDSVVYQIEFINGEIEILEGSKTVLFEGDSFKRKEKVSNLIIGDKIRIYENTSKERLFEIASEEDNECRLKKVSENSELWKLAFINYFKKKVENKYFYTEEDLLKELQNNGANIKLNTLKKWLNFNDKDLYPAQLFNLIAIKRTIENEKFNLHFDNIKKSKSFYRSIMIALGRDLSDEIMDYILTNKNKKGKILERFSNDQIQSFVNESAPLKKIKSINIIESENDE